MLQGYTGAGGVEIYFENKEDDAQKIWDAIFNAGATQGIKPVGLGARDTLRLEMGFCLYVETILTTAPHRLRQAWAGSQNSLKTLSQRRY